MIGIDYYSIVPQAKHGVGFFGRDAGPISFDPGTVIPLFFIALTGIVLYLILRTYSRYTAPQEPEHKEEPKQYKRNEPIPLKIEERFKAKRDT